MQVFFFYCDVDINILEQLDHAEHAGSIRGQANQCTSTTETGSLERIQFILPGGRFSIQTCRMYGEGTWINMDKHTKRSVSIEKDFSHSKRFTRMHHCCNHKAYFKPLGHWRLSRKSSTAGLAFRWQSNPGFEYAGTMTGPLAKHREFVSICWQELIVIPKLPSAANQAGFPVTTAHRRILSKKATTLKCDGLFTWG